MTKSDGRSGAIEHRREANFQVARSITGRRGMKLSKAQLDELRHMASARRDDLRIGLFAKNPNVAAALARLGLATRMRQSEQIRGERRYFWWVYKITDAGRAALKDATHD